MSISSRINNTVTSTDRRDFPNNSVPSSVPHHELTREQVWTKNPYILIPGLFGAFRILSIKIVYFVYWPAVQSPPVLDPSIYNNLIHSRQQPFYFTSHLFLPRSPFTPIQHLYPPYTRALRFLIKTQTTAAIQYLPEDTTTGRLCRSFVSEVASLPFQAPVVENGWKGKGQGSQVQH